LGGLDEPTQFIKGNGSPIMSPIFLGVESLHAAERIFPQSMSVMAPFRERFDGRSMMVASRQRTTSGLEGCEGLLDRLSGQVGEPGRRDELFQRRGNRADPLPRCVLGGFDV
jgi:hypothetical protein